MFFLLPIRVRGPRTGCPEGHFEINMFESEIGGHGRGVSIFASRASFTVSTNSTQLSSMLSITQGVKASALVPVKFPRPFFPQLSTK